MSQTRQRSWWARAVVLTAVAGCGGGDDTPEVESRTAAALVAHADAMAPLANKRVGPCPAGKACPGELYATLSAVAQSLQPGDVVDVYPDAQPYPPLKLTLAGTAQQPITLRGVTVDGQRPVLKGALSPANGSTALYVQHAHHLVIQSFEVTNGISRRRPDGTLDVSEYSHPQRCVTLQANDVTLRDVKVHGCPNHGILGSDSGTGSMLLDRVEVRDAGCNPEGMGCDDGKHPIYIATDLQAFPQAVLRIQNSWVYGNIGGESIKSRARRAELYYNWIESRGPFQERALGLFGVDVGQQASMSKPIHHDVVGNVLIADGTSNSRNNSVVRVGGDHVLSANKASTFGRSRFVNNTIVVNGEFGDRIRQMPVFRLFGRLEGFMAHNNLVHVADKADGRVVFLHEDDEDLQWTAANPPVAQARVLLTHNALPAGSWAMSNHAFVNYPLSDLALPTIGFAWNTWLPQAEALPITGVLDALTASKLRPAPDAALRGMGTTAANWNKHPADPISTFAVPNALPLPAYDAPDIRSGAVVLGRSRLDGAQPTPGALQ